MDGRDDATRVCARSKDVLARLAGARPVRHKRMWNRRRAIAAGTCALAVFTTGVATTGGRDVQAAPVAQVFTIGASDLEFILPQIKIAERHVAWATPQDPCAGLSDPATDPVASPLIASGLRTVDGSCNNLQPGQASLGAADQVVPRLTQPDFRPAQASPPDVFGADIEAVSSSSYTQSSGAVFDDEPRMISNLVDDQSATNPAAVAAASRPLGEPGPLPNNSLFTVFGQFFDHGMNKIVNGNNGSVFVPLRSDDPLIAGDDHVVGTADDLPAASRFMVLTRGTNVPGPGPDGTLGTADDTSHEGLNTDSSWVDLSQTYGSDPSHQVFLREYTMVDNRPQSTGRLLGSANGAMATWADVKAQAASELGLQLLDTDVGNIPMIAADAYGNLIPGPNGLAQYVTESGLVEGNLAAPVAAPADVRHLDTAFLNDIAPSAVPTAGGPDADDVAGLPTDTPAPPGTYDDELLGQHVIAGEGRANENVGLTAIHTIFEHEHNRLIADEQQVLEANPTILDGYQDTNCAVGCARNDPSLPTTFTYGERMFQAARFVNEMEYQHVVFQEFVPKVQPAADVTPLGTADTNAATTAEFAHTVSRFVDSMVGETIPRTDVDGTKSDIALRDASSNPAVFAQLTVDDLQAAAGDVGAAGAGAIATGLSDQVAGNVDEFVTETLRNGLTGSPLDLAAMDMTRARSEGIPTLNNVRKQIFAATNDSQLRPYASWTDFGTSLKNPESLVNFVAAFGQHPTIRDSGPDGILGNSDDVTTVAAKRDAARALALVDPDVGDVQPRDAAAFMNSTGAWANQPDNTSTTGVDNVDLWVGGLAEAVASPGALLGTTFNYVFELQIRRLWNNDRLNFLNRETLNAGGEILGYSFAELIMRNSTATTLNPDAFAVDDCKFTDLVSPATSGAWVGPGSVEDDPATACNENLMLQMTGEGAVTYRTVDESSPPPTTTEPTTTTPPPTTTTPPTTTRPPTTTTRPPTTTTRPPTTTTRPPTTTTRPPTTTTRPPTTTTTRPPTTTTRPPTTTTPPTTRPPTTTTPPTTAPPVVPSSQESMPVGDLPGWTQIFADDFTKNAPLGSFNDVYGTKWKSYSGPDTSGKIFKSKRSSYNTNKVVSVHGGVVDKYLHTEFDANGYNGAGDYMMSAALLPRIPGQLHGRYSVRLRADAVNGYKIAWLLWPDSGVWPRDGEIDFAETALADPLKAFIHRQNATAGSDQTACRTTNPQAYLSQGWHTVTLEWSTTLKIYVDGVLECSTSDRVPDTAMHLVLQTESEIFGPKSADSGHLYIDWVTVYKPSA